MKNFQKYLAALITFSMLTGTVLAESPSSDASQTPPPMPGDQQPGDGQTPPEMPGGRPGDGQAPPEMPGGEKNYTLTGVLSADGEDLAYDGVQDESELVSTSSDENVLLAQNGACLRVSNVTLNKTGDTTDSDATDFYAVNAVAAASGGSTLRVSDAIIESSARGGNMLFATGEGSVILARNATLHSDQSNSRGLDATFGGTVIGDNLTVTTEGDHCAAAATDRGNGFISLANSTLHTAGQGSPLIYSTGVIEAENVTGEAAGAQIVGMEGLNTVRLKGCDLTGSAHCASEPVANGVFLYQSMSGDSSEGTALFEAEDCTLTSRIDGGSMFYVTNTRAEVVLKDTVLSFDSENNALITVGGNSVNNWGVPGENGGQLKFTAIGETLSGNILCDGISSADVYLTDGSILTGAALKDDAFEGDGGTTVHLSPDSKWIVTADSTLTALSLPVGAVLEDADGRTVSVLGADGAVYVQGDSPLTVTVESFSMEDFTASSSTLSGFEIDRTPLDA